MTDNGYIKLYRSFLTWYGSHDPKRTSLWIHLLLLVNHEPAQWLFKGNPYQVERGQCLTSRKSLAKLTGISESTVERLLNEFEKEGQIKQQKSNRSRLISIINYNGYQKMDNRWTTDGQQMDTNKNDKNKKNIYIDHFDTFWTKYPNKIGRKKAEAHFKASVKSEQDWIDINKALDKYKQSKPVQDGYIQHGSTWFNNWRDWVDYVDDHIQTNKLPLMEGYTYGE